MCKNVTLSICIFTLLTAVAPPAPGGINDGLVAYYRLDETEGTVAADASGNGNDGMLLGAGLTWVEGRDAGALMCSGVDTDGRLEFSTAGMSINAGTFAAWGYLTDPQPETDGRYFFGHTSQPQFSNRIQLYLQEGTTPSRLLDIGLGGSHTTRTDIVELPMEEWLHVAMTWDNGVYGVYVNGAEVANGSYSGLTGLHSVANVGNDGSSAPYEAFGGMLDEARIYNRGLTAAEVSTIFHMPPTSLFLAQDPSPADGAADVPVDSVFSWTASQFAAAHDVYLGTSFDDVNEAGRANPMGVLLSQGQSATTYNPSVSLEFGTTYYWRIDEVNAPPDGTIFKGQVLSFTTEPLAYPIQGVIATTNAASNEGAGLENAVNGSGLNADDQHSTQANDMWLGSPGAEPVWVQFDFDKVYKLHELLVWNYNVQFEPVLGFGIKDVTIEFSADGSEWMVLGDAQFARATAKADYAHNTAADLGGVAARFVRLNVNSGWGVMGQYGLSEVRFMYIPVQAREPQPADGATGVDPDMALSWRAGREAASHDVYLGTDPEALSLVNNVTGTTLTPGTLEFGTTYYWRVDEVGDVVWAGDLWTFSTKEDALIDGFETYDDDVDAMTTIFDTWLDGWVNDTGSTVGYFDAPFAEQTIVRSGKQSMPLTYDNTTSPFYSEAERTFQTAQDWMGHGADSLVLYVQGATPAFAETADNGIVMSAIGTDIWDTADQGRFAYKSLSGDGSIVVRVDSLVRSNEWAKAGVMIRETLEAGSKHAFVAVTPEPSHGISFQRRPVAGQASANTDVADITIPHWVKLTRTGNIFTAQQSADGVAWTDVVVSPALEIQMAGNVYIGLALTSHDAAIATAAGFSNIATTGNVSGPWQTANIGVAQPEGGNTPASLYVAIEDSAGKVAVVINPDSAITTKADWNGWRIPYSELTGVNLSRVEVMTIGVGSRTSPTAGGTGTVYIDDIAYGKPASAE